MRIKPEIRKKRITRNGVTTVLRNPTYNYRPYVVVCVFALCFVILVANLFDIQLVNGHQLSAQANSTKVRTLTISGTRGKILDTNGIPLAVDQKNYRLEFYREYNTIEQRKVYTDSIIKALEILDDNSVGIETKFAIKYEIVDGEKQYIFNWGNVSQESAKTLEDRWRQDFYFSIKEDEKKDCKEMYEILRSRYHIPEDMPDEQAFKVLSVWQNSIQNYYYSRSITVAKNLSEDIVAKLESFSHLLSGFSITETTSRIYPQYETAAHIVGYMGRISAEKVDEYVKQKGYSTEDYIGVYGIEQRFEQYLTGNGDLRNGKRVVETEMDGTILRELSYQAPKQGDNVYLTIDINMQKIAEAALKENIETIYKAQMEAYNSKLSKYQKIEEQIGRKIKMAQTGAVVVMKVNSGAVLAQASYPSYDPNVFASGISSEQLQEMLADERGIFLNKAISSASTPGSIFKMVVGAAGLMEGVLTVDEKITDEGEYKKYVEPGYTGPRCWRWKDSHKTHGSINLAEAIMHSCNYFFYEVADRLGIDNIRKWASNFGLLSKTNIELAGETKGQVGNQQILYDLGQDLNSQETSMPLIVFRSIKNTIVECAEKSGVELRNDVLETAIYRMMSMIDITRSERLTLIRTILVNEMGLKRSIVDYETKFHISDYIEELIWTPTKTINTGIGQGITTLTPIAVARYVSAIVNGGTVYDAHIVDRVVNSAGNTVYETVPTVFNQLSIDDKYLRSLKEGMRDVVAGEESTTANKYFKDFKYKDAIGGKTGTAQVNTIDLENNSWFVAFAPYENPEIAIVVCIPNGYAGAMSSITIKAISEYYLDLKYKDVTNDIPDKDAIIN